MISLRFSDGFPEHLDSFLFSGIFVRICWKIHSRGRGPKKGLALRFLRGIPPDTGEIACEAIPLAVAAFLDNITKKILLYRLKNG